MNFIKKIQHAYSSHKVKRRVFKKINKSSHTSSTKTKKQESLGDYKSVLDNDIKIYLKKYTSNISGIDKGWYKYFYQMIEELLKNGLTNEDVIGVKEKYAEFRCHIEATNNEKQLVFDNIIGTYTNVINSRCQFCDHSGIKQSIEGWNFILCLKHYIEYEYDVSVDESIYEYKEFFKPKIDIQNYKNVSNSLHSQLEKQYVSTYISILMQFLKREESIPAERIRNILMDYFSTLNMIWVRDDLLSINDKKYKIEVNFLDEDGHRVMSGVNKGFQNKEEIISNLIDQSLNE